MPAIPGCLVTVSSPPLEVVYGPPLEYGYQPLLYDGYVVYFADDGIPYYWSGGTRLWVPTYARARYVSHWHRYKPAYRNWYKHHRNTYKTHRYQGRAGIPSRPDNRAAVAPDVRSAPPRHRDRDGNPPGPAGRPGTNWENRPGPAGGAGASPDRRRTAPSDWYRDSDLSRSAPRRGSPWENRADPIRDRGTAPNPRQSFPRERDNNVNPGRSFGGADAQRDGRFRSNDSAVERSDPRSSTFPSRANLQDRGWPAERQIRSPQSNAGRAGGQDVRGSESRWAR
ncbi:hypothetical protein CCR95_09900 [Thiocystis minor]|uniref:hypothetical protein n=1 Tax=Thiocystis minor TaxID=61597 RepID=UPI001911CD44|nr:hypothetical protein [Thiocystis minor]MBK5964388.1 hypothetical protein [Thiocystis minor]